MSSITPHDIGLPTHFTQFRYDAKSRTDQFDIAYSIASSSKRFNILGAPPGSGKTIINIAAGLLDAKPIYRILYLVSTNQLLQQVYEDFKSIGVESIIGMGNYICNDAVDNDYTTRRIMCNEGKCLSGISCNLRTEGCDYHDAVTTAGNASIVLSNFAYRASTARYSDPNKIGKFDLVICDEAHLLLDWMTGFCTVKLDKRVVKRLLKLDLPDFSLQRSASELPSWSRWANDNIDPLTQLYEEKRASGTTAKKLNEIRQLGRDLRTLSNIAKGDIWVVEPWRFGVEITPVEPSQFLEQYIYLNADKIILSSASVTSTDAPLYACGDDYQFIQGGAGFPVAHRPLIYIPTCTVSRKSTPESLRYWTLQIDSLCELGSVYRGIIQSVSYPRMQYIYDHANEDSRSRMIIHRSASGRDRSLPNIAEALEIFYSTHNSILVSPVIGTGYDFKYDRARWQIICKIPFLNPTSPIVKARKKLWRSKYKLDYLTVTAAKSVVQMYGRITRAKDDWGVTYVIDDPWGKYVGKSSAIPMHVKNAMSTCWQGLPGTVEPLVERKCNET
jgi:Rad3-related DNA helicase